MGPDAEAAPLVAEIDREAEAQGQGILGEAREKAAAMAAAAEARIQGAREEAARAAQKLARVDEDRLLGQARLEAQAEKQQGLRRVYQRVFQAARERLASLAGSPATLTPCMRSSGKPWTRCRGHRSCRWRRLTWSCAGTSFAGLEETA